MVEPANNAERPLGLLALAIALISFVMMGSALTVSAAQASWSVPADVSAVGVNPGSVITAAGTDGTAAIVWLDDGQVVASFKPSGAGFGEPKRLGTGVAPQLAVNDDGRILVAWIAGDEVALAERAPGGSLAVAGTAMRVAGLSGISLAFNQAGRELIAYVSPSRRGLVTRAAGEQSFSPAWSTNVAASYGKLKVGGGSDPDAATTVWSDPQGGEMSLYGVHWAAGEGAGSKQLIDTFTAPIFGSTSVVLQMEIVGSENPMLIYNVKTTVFGDMTKLRASTIADGTLGPVKTLLDQTFFAGTKPAPEFRVAMLTGGRATVGWRTMVGEPGTPDYDFGVAMVPHDGTGLGETQQFLSLGHETIELLALGGLPNGRTSVIYQTDTEILETKRSADGSTEGDVSVVAGIDEDMRLDDVEVAGDRSGGLFATWVRNTDDGNRIQVAMYDEQAPDATITGPASAVAGQPVSFSVKGDSWSPATISWAMGDDSTGTGPSVSHSYEVPGTYEISASVTDAAGNSATAIRSLKVSPAPDPGPDPDPTPAPVASLSKVTVKGPAKLKRGKKAVFRVKITNGGKASANVIKVSASGRGVKAKGGMRSIPGGKSRIVTLRLKPRKTGKFKVKFQATSSNAGKRTVSKRIIVRK
ncbi:MAG: PKD domain-containing protein [Actinomycetota bacterium]|nr:PKD domain-containing protein [Actinomycetota bacterium]